MSGINFSEMSEADFKQNMLRGRGKCFFAVRENPQKYSDCVLWACANEVSLDPQCGSHSCYIYDLICCYDDKEPFLNAVLKSFENTRSDGGWKMLYLAEILNMFSLDGSEHAKTALWKKYDYLLQTLEMVERAPDGIFPERDDFAMLCVVLADGYKTALKFAKDIGSLFRKNSIYDGGDIDWLFISQIEKRMPKIERLAKNDGDLACFVRVMREYQEEQNRRLSVGGTKPTARNSDEEAKIVRANKRLKDEKLLVEQVKGLKVDFEETTNWHSVQCDVLGLRFDGYKVPAELLYYIYESTYCSECRNHALAQLSRRRLLTEDIARECLYDCNEDSVKLAASWLKRRGIEV